MPDNTQGSPSNPIVLASALLLAALCWCARYMRYSGPGPESPFFIFLGGLFCYPACTAGARMSGHVALLGFMCLKAL